MSFPNEFEDRTAQIRGGVRVGAVVGHACVVTVIQGPDAGKAVRLEDCGARRLLIGQSPICDVQLTDKTVSRRHAALELVGAALHLTDLDSTNGTTVNGVLFKEAILRGGETIALGGTTLRLEAENTAHEIPASTDTAFGRVLGASPEMRTLYPVCRRIAGTALPILIEGETGTGKELLAEAIHEASPRKDAPFVVFDCSTIAPEAIEDELFGHERGAVPGVGTERAGIVEEANGGTLFIDEIGELDPAIQTKLLRLLERQEARRIGASKWTKVDVRVIAATRRDLDREVQARRFREDLLVPLAAARIELPPLRRRSGDIALLTRCFWKVLGGDDADIPAGLVQRFEQYSWPGNVRELSHAVARQFALGDSALSETGAPLRDGSRADFMDNLVEQRVPLPRARQQVTAELERRYVKRMLELHDGNVLRAAAECGIGRRYFQVLKAKT